MNVLSRFLWFAALCVVPTQAATWYVAPNGSDSANCSSASTPCLSLNGAYQKASGGDIIQFAAGTYGSQSMRTKALTSDVVAQPVPGAKATFGGLTIDGATHFELRSGTTFCQQDCPVSVGSFVVNFTSPQSTNITLRNVDVKGWLGYTGGSNITMIGGSVGPYVDGHPQIAPSNGWQGQGVNFVFDGVWWHDITRTSSSVHTECLQVAGTTNMVIRNNKFTHCDVFDLSFTSYNGAGSVTNLLLENNYFASATDGGYFSVHFSAMAGGTVRFNSATQAMFVDTTAPNSGTLTVVGNNIVGGLLDGNSGGCLGSSMAGSYSYNITQGVKCGSTDLNVAPGFANAGTLDLSLTAGVKAIDFVPLTVAGPSTDINGNPRPYGAGRDAGAFEYGSSASTATNPPPSLRAVVN